MCCWCSELGAQVQDLREVCKTSAADRAAAAETQHDVESLSPRSAIQLPTAGPAVIPGKLVSVTARDTSPQHGTRDTADNTQAAS